MSFSPPRALTKYIVTDAGIVVYEKRLLPVLEDGDSTDIAQT